MEIIRYQMDETSGKLLRTEVLEFQHKGKDGKLLAIPRARVRTAERHAWYRTPRLKEYWIPLKALKVIPFEEIRLSEKLSVSQRVQTAQRAQGRG